MKTFPIIISFAALAAFVLFPLNVEITGSALFAAGLLGILVGDYNRPVRVLGRTAPVIFSPAAPMVADLGLAA